MNKLSMPDDAQAEKGMTPEQIEERQQALSKWRESEPDAEGEEK